MPSITKDTVNNCSNHQEYEKSGAFLNSKVQNLSQRIDDTIPVNAVPINVTSVKNPYIMTAYVIKEHEKTIEQIVRKLWKFVKTEEFLNKDNDVELNIGDMVIVHCENYSNMIELPSFICRGLITNITRETGDYYIFLVDYGTCVKLIRDYLSLVSHNFLPTKHLTKYVSVYNILPLCQKSNSSSTTILEDWSEAAIQYVKDLFAASKIIYFDHIMTEEKSGIEYGEFYLIIEDMTVCLSNILEIKHYAICSEKVQKLVKSLNYKQESKTEHIAHIKISNRANNKIQSFNSFKNSMRKRQISHSDKILIKSHVYCGIFTDVSHLGYPHEIHENWKEEFKSTRPMKLQKHMWPAINKRLNVVAVGPPQCGKTSGCAMAACGLATLYKHQSHKPTQPLILFLCSSSSDVTNVHSICLSLLSNIDGVKSVAALNRRTYRSVAATIYSGCQILVTTPRYLVRFLNMAKGVLSFDKLICLILDNADIILRKYYDSMAELFKKHNIIKNREIQGNNAPILQIILSATYWTTEMNNFVPVTMYKPYICIASLTEAIVFKQHIVYLELCKVESRLKTHLVSDLLKDDYKSLKTMIVCINAKEAKELNTNLLPTKETILIHEEMEFSDIQTLQEDWKACVCNFYPVLICTDAVLSKLNCTDIQWLIHYSVPPEAKTPFSYRLSVLLDILSQDKIKCKLTIIIDENIIKPLPSIIRTMQQMKVAIPPEFSENIEQIQLELERDKKSYAMCDQVKSFGFCEEFSLRNTCEFRHCVIPEVDAPILDIQITDKIKFKITHTHDVTHFSARILEHIPHSSTSRKITFSSAEFIQNRVKIQDYFHNVENKKTCTSTNVGDICVLEHPKEKFNRVQIRRIRWDRNVSKDIIFVDLKCVDTGVIYEHINTRDLLYIPDELVNLPSHIMEIYLAGVKPCDEEYMWNYDTNEFVRKWLAENYDERCYVTGKVCLTLGNTVWLEDVQIGVKVIGHADMMFSLKKKLIDENCTVRNEEHVPNLIKLCEIAGFTVNGGHS